MDEFISYNGNILPAHAPIIPAASRGLRYGDGVFETMRLQDGSICLQSYHFERLFSALSTLKFDVPADFTAEYLARQIISLCELNGSLRSARVRMNVFRKPGAIFDAIDHRPEILIETSPIAEVAPNLPEKGLSVDIYEEARKSCDLFSNLKSNNYLPYTMSALHATEHGLDECLILNTYDRIADSTIANVFWIENGVFFTPPLSEGCVNGVMRRHIVETLRANGYVVTEKELETSTLESADELLLTNAVSPVRWVSSYRDKKFSNNLAREIYRLLI